MKLHKDVIEEFDKKRQKVKDKAELKKIENQELKEVYRSIGFYVPSKEYSKACDEKGKTWVGAEIKEKLVWNVNTNNEGIFTCEYQFQAEILSLLYQMDFRLKRLEDNFKNLKLEYNLTMNIEDKNLDKKLKKI